jgi:hypothetical protein
VATQPDVLFRDVLGDAPAPIELPGSLDVEIVTATAVFDGSGAAGSFMPCIAVYSQSGILLSRTFPDQVLAVGDTAEVTYVPFLRRRTTAGVSTQAGFFNYAQTLGPWLYWPMQEAAGFPQDFSGNDFHATGHDGGPTAHHAPGPYADGYSMFFDLGQDYFRGLESMGPRINGCAWCVWVKALAAPAGDDGYGRLVRFNDCLCLRDNSHWAVEGPLVGFSGDSAATAGLNIWYFIVANYHNSNQHVDLYVNGVFDSDLGVTPLPGAGDGSSGAGVVKEGSIGAAWQADVCNFAFYSRLLTPTEIAGFVGG